MKQILGGIITLLGVAGMVYGGWLIIAGNYSAAPWAALGIGLVFLIAGISLLSNTRTPEEK